MQQMSSFHEHQIKQNPQRYRHVNIRMRKLQQRNRRPVVWPPPNRSRSSWTKAEPSSTAKRLDRRCVSLCCTAQLLQRDKLIFLMGFVDGAGPKDHTLHPHLVKLFAFG